MIFLMDRLAVEVVVLWCSLGDGDGLRTHDSTASVQETHARNGLEEGFASVWRAVVFFP